MMKKRLTVLKCTVLMSYLFIISSTLAAPVIEAHLINYTVEPRSGATFNHIEQFSIVIFADKLSKEHRSPYTLSYKVTDKKGNVIEDKASKIKFTLCNDMMVQVLTVGQCGDYNNVATVRLKTRQTRRPISVDGYSHNGDFWVKDEQANKYPRFEENEYKLESFILTDRFGKVVKQ